MSNNKGPTLYEFLTEAELQQYFSVLKTDLKIQNVSQLKYVTEQDLVDIGMCKPEIRRLKKFYNKCYPNKYISKIMKGIRPKKDSSEGLDMVVPENGAEKAAVKVPSKYIIPAESIVKLKQLGVGEFGVVQQGIWTDEDGKRIQVAIKCLSKEMMQSSMEFLKEAAIMHTIDAEHIVRLYGVVLDTSSLMLVTELAPLRSLLECLKEDNIRNSFSVSALCDFAVQICDGMCYLETKRLIHRDLAARNILVFSRQKVKISDFGLSRALGVGKDYYQTNFNVNLKLPIAWCAPECINYLRFTSSSDVWAFAVTLWEMFSYGFQPWAALTGQQILEAIDEPNYQRLEQPDACPKDYYSIMLKCWRPDPAMRLTFTDLITILPEAKPDRVQLVREDQEGDLHFPRLPYTVGDVVTVLDKTPIADNPTIWKGVSSTGKTGLFNASNTVAYLGTNVPSAKVFQRGDGRNVYSSRRRLCPEMISGPQGDLKHTVHIGINGSHFGDLTFLGDEVQNPKNIKLDSNQKLGQVPKQIVTPYKPSEDHDHTPLTRASSDVSDKAPLLRKVGDTGNYGPACEDWPDRTDDDLPNGRDKSFGKDSDHEYHEISDEEEAINQKKDVNILSGTSGFDMGPSLLDEVFMALGGSNSSGTLLDSNRPSLPKSEDRGVEFKNSFSKDTIKRKQATVKPISAQDEKTLDTAIAMANHLAAKSINNMEPSGNGHRDDPPPSKISPPHTPEKTLKFPFKLSRGSPKVERRHFSVEANSIADIQSSISDEAKEVYNILVERPSVECETLPEPSRDENNPLRMLRKGMTVRPKVRGNKHNSSTNVDRNSLTKSRDSPNFDPLTHQTLPRGFKHSKVPPPVKPKPTMPKGIANGTDSNPLPLPPRDRTQEAPNGHVKPRHQRKHPLLIPVGKTNAILRASGRSVSTSEKEVSSPRLLIQHTHNPLLESQNAPNLDQKPEESSSPKIPPEKPPRLHKSAESLDDSFDSQVAFEMEALDEIHNGNSPPGDSPPAFPKAALAALQGRPSLFDPDLLSDVPLYQSQDHVSCEDLLDFAMDKPNSKRTKGPAHGTRSDEVHLLMKVMKDKVTEEECLTTLNECKWDVHNALKLLQLVPCLNKMSLSNSEGRKTLDSFGWDVDKAKTYLIARSGLDMDSHDV